MFLLFCSGIKDEPSSVFVDLDTIAVPTHYYPSQNAQLVECASSQDSQSSLRSSVKRSWTKEEVNSVIQISVILLRISYNCVFMYSL